MYDLRVRPARYKVGDWVLYFNPRKYRGKQDKWRRKFTGPHLVVDVPGPVNVALQSGPKVKVFLTHIDKVKMYTGNQTPKPWIPGSLPTRPAPENAAGVGRSEDEDAIKTGGGGDEDAAEVGGEDEDEGVLESLPGEDLRGLGPTQEVVEADQVAQWWPPLVACLSPRPKRNVRLPARYRD